MKRKAMNSILTDPP